MNTQEAISILSELDHSLAHRREQLEVIASIPPSEFIPVDRLDTWCIFYPNRVDHQPTLSNFIGVIDLETTGLTQYDRVTHASGSGYIDGELVQVSYVFRVPGLVRVTDSVIANWNQPYDRQYYALDGGGVDSNTHYDLMGMALQVRGKPGKSKSKPFNQTWERYCYDGVSLSAVHSHWFGEGVDKTVRNDIILGLASGDEIERYCYEDVQATLRVASKVIPEYLEFNPSNISINGAVLRGGFVLPISDKWEGFTDRAEQWYQSELASLDQVVNDLLWESLIPTCPQHTSLHENYPERYQPRYLNGWLKYMGWEKPKRGKQAKRVMFSLPCQLQLLPLATIIANIDIHLFTPKYFWDALDDGFSASSRVCSLVIPCEFDGTPVTYDRSQKKWYSGSTNLENLSDKSKALSSMFCKDYIAKLGGELSIPLISPSFTASMKNTIRWGMFRDRIRDLEVRSGYLTPNYTPIGTLSSRATDKVTLLVGSPKEAYGGSEFMSMIEAKPGYCIVQADLDGAEFVLASLFASELAGYRVEDKHPLASANLNGSKSEGTDVHSIVARDMGIDRGGAKTLVYAAIYGQGDTARVAYLKSELQCSIQEATRLCQLFKQSFIRGLASDLFTALDIACDNHLPTRLLSRSVPLAYRYGEEFKVSYRNHQIQAVGVDWLDTLSSLIEHQSPHLDAKLILTRHDELIYHVADGDAEEFAGIMQHCHRVVKAAICHQFGVTEPNQVWLSFSSVDINKRYLKSPDSNPSTVTTQFD